MIEIRLEYIGNNRIKSFVLIEEDQACSNEQDERTPGSSQSDVSKI